MNGRGDVLGLVVGLLAVALAALGLWEAFGTVVWSAVAIAAPLLVVIVGLVGLLASRGKS